MWYIKKWEITKKEKEHITQKRFLTMREAWRMHAEENRLVQFESYAKTMGFKRI